MNYSEHRTDNLAVLIDADNAQPDIIEGLLGEIANQDAVRTGQADEGLEPIFRLSLPCSRWPFQPGASLWQE